MNDNMNRIKRLMAALAACVFVAVSCDVNDQTQPEEIYLDVNANNISGQWELVEWNGTPLTSCTYVYLDIGQNDRTYTI